MGLYFSGTAGYGFGIEYTPQVFTLLKDYYEETSGKKWDWDYKETDMDFIGGETSIFTGIYVQTLRFEMNPDHLYIIDESTRVPLEKTEMVPVRIKGPTNTAVLDVLMELAELYDVELGPVIYTDYS